MAFKTKQNEAAVPETPRELFELLPRKVMSLLEAQSEILEAYSEVPEGTSDVAFQISTGGGKTLIGLLIAEWWRRKHRNRVIFLCPTRQLVNQVVEQAHDKYGLGVLGFTGSASSYSQESRADYQQARQVAITTYSALFNTNPFFTETGLILLDDAHAAENYIAKFWSVAGNSEEYPALHEAIKAIIKDWVESSAGRRFSEGDKESWVDVLPLPTFLELREQLAQVFEVHCENTELQYPWSVLSGHLSACQLFFSPKRFLLRPLIPPTWTHSPFASAKQRIYMSATLGAGGDLERQTGRPKILRLCQGPSSEVRRTGRRFFIFPSASLLENELASFRELATKEAGRAVVLTSNQASADAITKELGQVQVYRAKDLEITKKNFISSEPAIAVMANRYDGIDFPDGDCRLLFIDGLAQAVNLQEEFLITRMGARALFSERIQTRVIQAIGRCTRSSVDYATVVVTGDELCDHLSSPTRRSYLPGELQAEIEVGLDQSRGQTLAGLVENLQLFLQQSQEWQTVEETIFSARKNAATAELPGLQDLANVVRYEIEFMTYLWNGDLEQALESAGRVLASLNHTDLRGYRVAWNYFAGCAAWELGKRGRANFESRARAYFAAARDGTIALPWLSVLAESPLAEETRFDVVVPAVARQLEGLERVIEKLGVMNERRYAEKEKEVLDGLKIGDSHAFEHSQEILGWLLGFSSGKVEAEASPDPWWVTDPYFCLVFEDYTPEGEDVKVDATKARQASTHPNWIREHLKPHSECKIVSVMVSTAHGAHAGAKPHLQSFGFWKFESYCDWVRTALSCLRQIRRIFPGTGDLLWRSEANDLLLKHSLTLPQLAGRFETELASEILILD